jgi:hypothetical protein
MCVEEGEETSFVRDLGVDDGVEAEEDDRREEIQ